MKIRLAHTNIRRSSGAFTLVELLVVVAIIAALTALGIFATQKLRQRALLAKLAGNSRQISTAYVGYMTEYGKMPALVFGSLYPTRELCKTLDGVGAGYCGPEWRVPGTPAWKKYGTSRNSVWVWAAADAQLITGQGRVASISDASNRPILFYGAASASGWQDDLGVPGVITRMQAFANTYLQKSTVVSCMDGSAKVIANVNVWKDPAQGWNEIWPPSHR